MILSPVHLFETQQVVYKNTKALTGLGPISLYKSFPRLAGPHAGARNAGHRYGSI